MPLFFFINKHLRGNMVVDFSNFYLTVNKKFWDFIESKCRIRVSLGGAGSGKSFSAFQEIAYKILVEPGHNYLICRKVANTNKTSTYALFKQVLSHMGLTDLFTENKSDLTFTVKETGYMVIFKGLDDIEKLKSITFPKGVLTDVVIEEASEVSQKDFDQLNIRLRGQKPSSIPFQLTLLLNPINETHWIKREFFDLKSYQKSTSVYIIHSTYLDNEYIDEDYKAILEGYKDIDYEYYKVYCLGEWGSYGNVIFNNYTVEKSPYTEDDFDAVYTGMDFGHTHPSMIIKTGLKDGVMYSYAELCVVGKTNKEFIEANKEFDILRPGERCTADSAEPSRIKEWVQFGYSVVPAIKGKDSVSRGIDYIKSHKWVIDPSCVRLIQEVQVYRWQEDKDGTPIEGKPVDIMDDGIKSVIYAFEQLSRLKGKPSTLSGKKSDHKKDLIEAKKEERKKLREAIKAQRKLQREKVKK